MKYLGSGGLNNGNLLTTFLISYLLGVEGLKKDEIEDSGKRGFILLAGIVFSFVTT